jgi:Skp family chaperone for outer membrane proteins
MNFIKAISIFLLATALNAGAAPRFAVVRIKGIYTALPSTIAIQQQIKTETAEIMKDKRAEQLRKIITELQTLQTQLSDKSAPIDEATRRKLARAYEIKRQEAQTLQQEFENFKAEQEKAINAKMIGAMRASLNRITEASGKVATERGYEAVFDSSGNTNTGVPFILYSKNAPDLTADVQAALKDSEPATPAAKPVTATPASGAGKKLTN